MKIACWCCVMSKNLLLDILLYSYFSTSDVRGGWVYYLFVYICWNGSPKATLARTDLSADLSERVRNSCVCTLFLGLHRRSVQEQPSLIITAIRYRQPQCQTSCWGWCTRSLCLFPRNHKLTSICTKYKHFQAKCLMLYDQLTLEIQ